VASHGLCEVMKIYLPSEIQKIAQLFIYTESRARCVTWHVRILQTKSTLDEIECSHGNMEDPWVVFYVRVSFFSRTCLQMMANVMP
jgi:hypothetical protein